MAVWAAGCRFCHTMIYNSDCPPWTGYNIIDKKVGEMGRLLGKLVRETRLERTVGGKPLSIRQLADRLGVHHSYLSRIERGDDVCLKPERLMLLADLLGVDRYFMLAVAGIVPEKLREAIYDHREAFTMFIRCVVRNEPDGDDDAVMALANVRSGHPHWSIPYADGADLLCGLVDAMSAKGWIVSRMAQDRMATQLSTCELPFCDIDLRRGVVTTDGVRSLRVYLGLRGTDGGVSRVYRSRRVVTGRLGTMISILGRMRHAMGAWVRVVDGFDMVVFDSHEQEPLRMDVRADAGDSFRHARGCGGTAGAPDNHTNCIVFERLARRSAGTHENRLQYERALGKLAMSAHAFFPWDEMEAFSYIIVLSH
ncbi:helix-turn-helix transcriptional regulator [Desulfovibrio sp. XJ01]|nr:helix-turn-helix transcriptional regulator [Nitratidesulfovibrio liaohensis]